MISKVEFAKWDVVNQEFFSGKLTQDLKIKIWQEEVEIANYWIDEVGKVRLVDHPSSLTPRTSNLTKATPPKLPLQTTNSPHHWS